MADRHPHQGRLEGQDAEHMYHAECACGWSGMPFFGRSTAAREHDAHLTDVGGPDRLTEESIPVRWDGSDA